MREYLAASTSLATYGIVDRITDISHVRPAQQALGADTL